MASSSLPQIDLVTPTVEAVMLNAMSSIVAQGFTAWQSGAAAAFDLHEILRFVLYTAITTPPNYGFQYFLESRFPTSVPSRPRSAHHSGKGDFLSSNGQSGEERISIRHTLIKFVLDQSLAATINTACYIVLMGALKSRTYSDIQSDLFTNFWSLLFASYHFWPFVCLINLVLVPLKYRPMMATMAGLAWGVFLNLR